MSVKHTLEHQAQYNCYTAKVCGRNEVQIVNGRRPNCTKYITGGKMCQTGWRGLRPKATACVESAERKAKRRAETARSADVASPLECRVIRNLEMAMRFQCRHERCVCVREVIKLVTNTVSPLDPVK